MESFETICVITLSPKCSEGLVRDACLNGPKIVTLEFGMLLLKVSVHLTWFFLFTGGLVDRTPQGALKYKRGATPR